MHKDVAARRHTIFECQAEMLFFLLMTCYAGLKRVRNVWINKLLTCSSALLSHQFGPIIVTAQMIFIWSTPRAQSSNTKNSKISAAARRWNLNWNVTLWLTCQGKNKGVWSRGTRRGATTTSSKRRPSNKGTRPIRARATMTHLRPCKLEGALRTLPQYCATGYC